MFIFTPSLTIIIFNVYNVAASFYMTFLRQSYWDNVMRTLIVDRKIRPVTGKPIKSYTIGFCFFVLNHYINIYVLNPHCHIVFITCQYN